MLLLINISPATFQHLNKPNTVCGQRKHFCVSDLMDASPTTVSKADLLASEPDYQFVLPFNNYAVSESQIYTREFYNHFLSAITHHTNSFQDKAINLFLPFQILALDDRPSSELSET